MHEPIGTANGVVTGDGDWELLNRFVRERDEAAFAHLVDRHGRMIWALCRRVLQAEHDAEDAYQVVFVVLARKAASIRRGEAVGSWLYRVAYRIAVRARRSVENRRALEHRPAAAGTADKNSPCSEAALRELQRLLDEEVDRLTDKLRAPFVLCCLEGMSKPEAARELGWPEETVKARLAQARRLLRTRLVRRGITLSAILTAAALAKDTATAAPAVVAPTAAANGPLGAAAPAWAEGMASGLSAAKFKATLALLVCLTLTFAGASLVTWHPGFAGQGAEVKEALAGNPPEPFLNRPASLQGPHDEQVLAVALSPDGKRLVTAGAWPTLPGQFMIWDVENRQPLLRERGLNGIRGVAFAPDGSTVACGTFGGTIHLRDVRTGKVRAVLDGHAVGVNAVAYSATGALLASAGIDQTVKLWDVRKLAEKRCFVGHAGEVFAVAFFRHGTAIVSGSNDGTARIWDLDSGEVKFTLRCPAAVQAVAVAPDDRTIATASWDRTIRLWDAATGREKAELRSVEGSLLAIAFSADGTLLASTSADGSIRLWDVQTRTASKHLERHAAEAWSVAFSPDSKVLATGSADRTVKLWDVAGGTEIATLATTALQPEQAKGEPPNGKEPGDEKKADAVGATRKANVRMPKKTLPPTPEQKRAIATLQRLHAKYKFDAPDQPVVHVSFEPGTEVDDVLEELLPLTEIGVLGLQGTKISDAGLKQVAGLKKLHQLYLGQTAITDAGLKELAGLTSLTHLGLENTRITDAALKAIAPLINLNYLNIGGTAITDGCLKDIGGFPRLGMLCLYSTDVTDAGMKELKGLTSLRTLLINNTALTDAGIKELAPLKQLKKIDATNTMITDAGLKALQESVPAAKVEADPGVASGGLSGRSRSWLWAAGVVAALIVLGATSVARGRRLRPRAGPNRAALERPPGKKTDAAEPPRISLQCPHCQHKLRVSADRTGKSVRCPACGARVDV